MLFIYNELFFKGMKDDQKVAEEYMLSKVDESKHNDQLLMQIDAASRTNLVKERLS